MSACVEAGTHHVDISGEPQYLEKMQLKFHKEAQEKGVKSLTDYTFVKIC